MTSMKDPSYGLKAPSRAHLIPKGVSLNPAGRPKGTLSESTKISLKIKHQAGKDAPRVYQALLERVLAGDSKAMSIWFDLYGRLPKRWKEEMVELPNLEGKDTTQKIQAIEEALVAFKDYTYEELLQVFKALAGVKMAEAVAEGNQRLTMDETKEQLRLVEETMEKMKIVEGGEE